MGAVTFSQVARGASAKEAFQAAQEEARYNYGHAGYTGTIAEKDSFVQIYLAPHRLGELKGKNHPYYEYDPDDPNWDKVDDKWGPAGCIDLDDGRYLFFGWASS